VINISFSLAIPKLYQKVLHQSARLISTPIIFFDCVSGDPITFSTIDTDLPIVFFSGGNRKGNLTVTLNIPSLNAISESAI
jgi:hypothetical protein